MLQWSRILFIYLIHHQVSPVHAVIFMHDSTLMVVKPPCKTDWFQMPKTPCMLDNIMHDTLHDKLHQKIALPCLNTLLICLHMLCCTSLPPLPCIHSSLPGIPSPPLNVQCLDTLWGHATLGNILWTVSSHFIPSLPTSLPSDYLWPDTVLVKSCRLQTLRIWSRYEVKHFVGFSLCIDAAPLASACLTLNPLLLRPCPTPDHIWLLWSHHSPTAQLRLFSVTPVNGRADNLPLTTTLGLARIQSLPHLPVYPSLTWVLRELDISHTL